MILPRVAGSSMVRSERMLNCFCRKALLIPCSQTARTASAAKAANSTNSTTRERQVGRDTCSTGLFENDTPLEAATREPVTP